MPLLVFLMLLSQDYSQRGYVESSGDVLSAVGR